jgi:hypothetical protein
MATYSREEVTITTVRYVVPATRPYGAHPDEITKAATAAATETREKGGTTLRFVPSDESINIEFDIEAKQKD